jgi:hypothetical protein
MDDEEFAVWLTRLDITPQATPGAEARAVVDNSRLEKVLVEANDPDFESEILFAASEILPHDQDWTCAVPSSPTVSLGQLLNHLAASVVRVAHPLAIDHVRAAVSGYRRQLRNVRLMAGEHPELQSWPLVPALLELYNRKRRTKKWKWSTTLRHLAELQGALVNMNLFLGLPPIRLASDPEWAAALKFVASQTRSERPKFAKSAGFAQIQAALEQEPSEGVRLLLLMTWLCAGRTGDIRQLDTHDIVVRAPTGDERTHLTVTFRRGKTVKKRGPYSLHTSLPRALALAHGIQEGCQHWGNMRTATVGDVLTALRRIDPQLENRSLRRGALHALANDGVAETVLLLFSGHATLHMLRRYLGWGSIGLEKQTTMSNAARVLTNEATNIVGGSSHVGEPSPPDYALVFDLRKHTHVGPTPPVLPPQYLAPRRRRSPLASPSPVDRWLDFLGVEAPPAHVLPGFVASTTTDELHSKPVLPSADTNVLLSFADDIELRQYSAYTFPWLSDEDYYKRLEQGLPALRQAGIRYRTRGVCKLSDGDVSKQVSLEKYEPPSSPGEQQSQLLFPRLSTRRVKAWCRVFTVPEPAKRRRRHIAEPLINDWFLQTPTLSFASRQERHAAIGRFHGGFAVSLDYASCFDLYALDPRVRPYFGIHLPDGRVSRMAVLPMGFRPAAAVAQAGTWCVADIPVVGRWRRGVDYCIITYIDNILVLAHKAEVASAVTRLVVARSAQAGLRLNEHFPCRPLEWSPEPQQVFDFLGETFDLRNGTVVIAEKTVAKIASIPDAYLLADAGKEQRMTKRQVAAVIGLFLFASGGCAVLHRRYMFHAAVRYHRDVMSLPALDWDDLAPKLDDAAARSFQDWSAALLRNEPLDITTKLACPVSDIIFTDASETRWSATHISSRGLRVYAADWTPADFSEGPLSSSVTSEPLAIRRALCRAISPTKDTHVVVYTDHASLVDALRAPVATCTPYWKLQAFLANWPSAVEVRFIPGELNPADAFTRGVLEVQLAVQHTAEWKNKLCNAQVFHGVQQVECDGKGNGGSSLEWTATARNPLRPLLRGNLG